MRSPAVAIVTAFACGILLGEWHPLQRWILPVPSLAASLLFVAAGVLLAFALTLCGYLRAAAAGALLCWCALGLIATAIALQPLPTDHVLNRIAGHQIEPKTPLRWYGQLRTEPERLPWGYGLDLDLSGVETADGFLPNGPVSVGFA